MSRFHLVSIGSVVVLCLSLSAAAQANTIDIPVPNGDFSSPETTSYIQNIEPTSWTDTHPGGTGVAVGGMNGSGDQFFFQGINANETQWLYQTDVGATFVAGDAYTLDFYYANGQTTPYELTANIIYGGGPALVANVYSVAASQGWTHGSISGTATSTTAGTIGIVFKFVAGSGANQPWLDHVTLTQTSAVPEPTTIMLTMTGLVGLLAYAWRKRR